MVCAGTDRATSSSPPQTSISRFIDSAGPRRGKCSLLINSAGDTVSIEPSSLFQRHPTSK